MKEAKQRHDQEKMIASYISVYEELNGGIRGGQSSWDGTCRE